MKYIVKNEHYIEAKLGHGDIVISSNEEKGYRPVELLVSAIASCSGSVFHSILTKQRTQFSELSIEADVQRNENEANKVEKILLHFTVKGKQITRDKLERNLQITRRYCGMIRSVEDSIEVEEKLTIVNE